MVFVVERRTTKFVPTKQYRIVPGCGLVVYTTTTKKFLFQIDKMEAKVVKPLLEYEGMCKKAKVRLHVLYM